MLCFSYSTIPQYIFCHDKKILHHSHNWSNSLPIISIFNWLAPSSFAALHSITANSYIRFFLTSVHVEHVSLSAHVASQGLCGWRAFRVPPFMADRWSCWSMGGVLGMLSPLRTTPDTSKCSDVVVLLRATTHICSCQSQCWWARHSWHVFRDLQWDLRLSSSHPSPLPIPCSKTITRYIH